MDDNNLLMIILAFVVGFMLQGMMKNMCGGRFVEGLTVGDEFPMLYAYYNAMNQPKNNLYDAHLTQENNRKSARPWGWDW